MRDKSEQEVGQFHLNKSSNEDTLLKLEGNNYSRTEIIDSRTRNLCLIKNGEDELTKLDVEKQIKDYGIRSIRTELSELAAITFNHIIENNAKYALYNNIPLDKVSKCVVLSYDFLQALEKEQNCHGNEGVKGVLHAVGNTSVNFVASAAGGRLGTLVGSQLAGACGTIGIAYALVLPYCSFLVPAGTILGSYLGSKISDKAYNNIVEMALNIKQSVVNNGKLNDFVYKYAEYAPLYREQLKNEFRPFFTHELNYDNTLLNLDIIAKGEYILRQKLMEGTPSSHPYHAPIPDGNGNFQYHPNDLQDKKKAFEWQKKVKLEEQQAKEKADRFKGNSIPTIGIPTVVPVIAPQLPNVVKEDNKSSKIVKGVFIRNNDDGSGSHLAFTFPGVLAPLFSGDSVAAKQNLRKLSSVNLTSGNGESLLFTLVAETKYHSPYILEAIKEFLEDERFEYNLVDSAGNSLLHHLVINNYESDYTAGLLKLLLEKGCNPYIANNNGETALKSTNVTFPLFAKSIHGFGNDGVQLVVKGATERRPQYFLSKVLIEYMLCDIDFDVNHAIDNKGTTVLEHLIEYYPQNKEIISFNRVLNDEEIHQLKKDYKGYIVKLMALGSQMPCTVPNPKLMNLLLTNNKLNHPPQSDGKNKSWLQYLINSTNKNEENIRSRL